MRRHSSRVRLAAALAAIAAASFAAAQPLDPIVYTVRVPSPDTRYAQVEAVVPTGGRASIEMMMPVWSRRLLPHRELRRQGRRGVRAHARRQGAHR
jgi:hypothetical protein